MSRERGSGSEEISVGSFPKCSFGRSEQVKAERVGPDFGLSSPTLERAYRRERERESKVWGGKEKEAEAMAKDRRDARI